jgi:hypothetical protein
LGWLDESEVPEVPELAMIIVYRAGNIKEHRFIVGGKSSEHQLDLKNLYDLCPGLTPVDSTKPLEGSVKINFTTLVFQPGRKTTPWVPIQAMFKGSLAWSNCTPPDWSKIFLYTRYRLLESPAKPGSSGPYLSLNIEGLPLQSALELCKPELLKKYESSSTVSINLTSVPLLFMKAVTTKAVFTTPFLVLQDAAVTPALTDGIVRLSMDTIRDTLRSGREAIDQQEAVATVHAPVFSKTWERCSRRLHMPTGTSVSFTETGKENYKVKVATCIYMGQTLVRTPVSLSIPACQFPDPMPGLRSEYRVFARGDRLIFGNKYRTGDKYSATASFVIPNTSLLLGEGAPIAYHEALAGALSSSVASKTKSSYQTAVRMLERCQSELGRQMSMPLSEQDVLCFVAYMQTRKVADKTTSGYLAGLRLATISMGYPCSTLVTPVVKQVLKGIKNMRSDPRADIQKKTRRAMTFSHLQLLGHSIGTSKLSPYMRSLVWATSLSAFWGSLRIGELLCPQEVDVRSSCLFSDCEMNSSGFKIWVRSPKVASPQGDVVEVFFVPSSSLDPLAAMQHYLVCRNSRHGQETDKALFLGEDGRPFTRRRFNYLLHELLDHHVKDNRDAITGHSFRSGLATLMEVAGMSPEEIKAWGRWNSEAYLLYCKEGRSKAKVWSKLHEVLFRTG